MNKDERQNRGTIVSVYGSVAVVRGFDSGREFCDSEHMRYSARKSIAVLLAIWLPLFAGNALAASITMQLMGEDCHTIHSGHTRSELPSHGAVRHTHTGQRIAHIAPCDQLNGSGKPLYKNCSSGICSYSCAGHITASSIEIAVVDIPSLPATLVWVRFQSAFYVPLLPPPLARV